jgi:hypothetical protein
MDQATIAHPVPVNLLGYPTTTGIGRSVIRVVYTLLPTSSGARCAGIASANRTTETRSNPTVLHVLQIFGSQT